MENDTPPSTESVTLPVGTPPTLLLAKRPILLAALPPTLLLANPPKAVTETVTVATEPSVIGGALMVVLVAAAPPPKTLNVRWALGETTAGEGTPVAVLSGAGLRNTVRAGWNGTGPVGRCCASAIAKSP